MTPPPADRQAGMLLSDRLVEAGLVTSDAMSTALSEMRLGGSLNEVLVDRGIVSEEALSRTIAAHYGFEHVDLERFQIDVATATCIPGAIAKRHEALPIAGLPDGAMVVAVHDPNGTLAASVYGRETGREIRLAVASRSQILAAIERVFKRDSDFVEHATPAPAAGESGVRDGGGSGASPELMAMVREATERAAAAEARAAKAEAQLAVAQERIAAAQERADSMAKLAEAANATVERLMRAAEIFERSAAVDAGAQPRPAAPLRADLHEVFPRPAVEERQIG